MFSKPFQRALEAIEHPAQETGSEAHRKRHAHALHRLASRKTAGVLVDLDHRLVLLDPHHFPGEHGMSDVDAFIEFEALEIDAHGRS